MNFLELTSTLFEASWDLFSRMLNLNSSNEISFLLNRGFVFDILLELLISSIPIKFAKPTLVGYLLVSAFVRFYFYLLIPTVAWLLFPK